MYVFLAVSFLQYFLPELGMHSCPIRSTHPAHLILHLNFVIIFGEQR
jgi:hypothetical protein